MPASNLMCLVRNTVRVRHTSPGPSWILLSAAGMHTLHTDEQASTLHAVKHSLEPLHCTLDASASKRCVLYTGCDR
jgi:hypothetical protein